MILTGYFAGLTDDMINKKTRITFEVNEREKAIESVPDLEQKELKISVTQKRKRRSLNANAYYWVLVGKMAEVLQITSAYIHNTMMRRYGQIQVFDDQAVRVVLKETEEVRKRVDEAEDVHLRPTAELRKGKDGLMYRTYLLLKGSHEYDTKEMARLIDGIVSDARELGIETLPPHELERMLANWKV